MLDLFPSREAGPFGRRLKRERGARVPVTVVTGFLGAGKTTLIRRFLASAEGQGTAVIVNEFGAVSIDDALIRGAAEQTILLGNGCLCCITRTDLQLALRALVIDRERGVVPNFARVVIETSGLADPGPILQTFSTDRALGGEFHIDGMQRLQQLNPRAGIDIAVGGALEPARFIAPAIAERSGFIAEAEHSDGISSFVLEGQQPVVWPAFSRAMETLIALRGADLLRVKGILNVAGCPGPVVVQYVQHLVHPPVELQSWPDQNCDSRVVFIARNIPEAQIRDLFAAVEKLTKDSN